MRWWFKLGFSARRNKIISHASFYFVGFHYQKLRLDLLKIKINKYRLYRHTFTSHSNT